jgi:Mitochondrial carrier protein
MYKVKDHPWEYLCASALAATINYPLWRASAVGQSGFVVAANGAVNPSLALYRYAFGPPYRGLVATVAGMTWARAAIFWGSDYGRDYLLSNRQSSSAVGTLAATVGPPLIVSTLVQCVNMPLVRATITMQNPQQQPILPTVRAALHYIYVQNGNSVKSLWHGTSAGILKTVPKYCTAVLVKDAWDRYYYESGRRRPPHSRSEILACSAAKSVTAGMAGAILTNPLDVIRNEMFKMPVDTSRRPRGLVGTVRHLMQQEGWKFVVRGLDKNIVAVSVPVACTIFFTDVLIQYSNTTT